MSDSDAPDSPSGHSAEPHAGGFGQRLNWLRAGVLGADDGIVSTAGLVVGVAAVTPEPGPILTAGIAGLVAGAVSMALGELRVGEKSTGHRTGVARQGKG
jgi:VIT1/CCC1 family predicted Fe2+/Mn2+ transporter